MQRLMAGGMELCWLYGWATFLTGSLLHQNYPLPEAVASFALAALLTHFTRGRGWRVITILGFALLFFLPLLWWMFNLFSSWSPTFSSHIDAGLFNATMSYSEWIVALLLISWGIIFWGQGNAFARRGMDYPSVCQRFDVGLAAFFALVLAGYALKAYGIEDPDRNAAWYIFPFFLFGLTQIALARVRSGQKSGFVAGCRPLGVVVSFATLLLLFTGGTLMFFWPYLSGAGQAGYEGFKKLVNPLAEPVAKAIDSFFAYEVRAPVAKTAKTKLLEKANSYPDWWNNLFHLLSWAALLLLAAALLLALGAFLFFTLRLFFSRTERWEARREKLVPSKIWRALGDYLASFAGYLRKSLRGPGSGRDYYALLLKWGKTGGVGNNPQDTPREFCLRLRKRFPMVGGEMELIVELFNREVYGKTQTSREERDRAATALKKLQNPALWLVRLKSRLQRV